MSCMFFQITKATNCNGNEDSVTSSRAEWNVQAPAVGTHQESVEEKSLEKFEEKINVSELQTTKSGEWNTVLARVRHPLPASHPIPSCKPPPSLSVANHILHQEGLYFLHPPSPPKIWRQTAPVYELSVTS